MAITTASPSSASPLTSTPVTLPCVPLRRMPVTSPIRSSVRSWTRERRAVARIEATTLGLDIRFIVTSLRFGTAEFATLRLRLLKVAARVIETANRVRLAFAAACPEAELFRSLPSALWPSAP